MSGRGRGGGLFNGWCERTPAHVNGPRHKPHLPTPRCVLGQRPADRSPVPNPGLPATHPERTQRPCGSRCASENPRLAGLQQHKGRATLGAAECSPTAGPFRVSISSDPPSIEKPIVPPSPTSIGSPSRSSTLRRVGNCLSPDQRGGVARTGGAEERGSIGKSRAHLPATVANPLPQGLKRPTRRHEQSPG